MNTILTIVAVAAVLVLTAIGVATYLGWRCVAEIERELNGEWLP